MNLSNYYKETKFIALLTGLVISLVYGPLIFATEYHADLEYIILTKGSMYNWSALDRFGLILVKKLTSLSWYNPFFEGFLFIITLMITVFFLSYLFRILMGQISPMVPYIATALFLIFPTFTEQFYFRFQCFEMLFAMLLLLISALMLHTFIKDKKIYSAFIAVILSVISFGIYQAMLNLMITFYLGMFTLMLFNEEKKTIIRGTITCPSHFLISAFLYKLVCMIVCKSDGYFSDKIFWDDYPFSTCYHFVKHYIRNVLLGEKYVYTLSFLIMIIVSLIAFVMLLIKIKAKALLNLVGIIGLMIAPFLLAILQGFEAEARTQLSLPLSIAFLWLFVMAVIDKFYKKAFNKIDLSIPFIALAFICLIMNIVPSERLIYSYKMQADFDEAIMHEIAMDLTNYNCKPDEDDALPVIILGQIPYSPNASCYEYNEENDLYILSSVFSLDKEVSPEYFFSTNRIIGAMNANGYKFKAPQESIFMNEAYANAASLPSFPNEGYILQTDNYVLVKLSDIN